MHKKATKSNSRKDLNSLLTTQQIKLSSYTGELESTSVSQEIPSSARAAEALGSCKIHSGQKYEQCCEKCLIPVCAKCKKELHRSHPCKDIPELIDSLKETLSLELNELRFSVIPCFVETLNDEQNLPEEFKLQVDRVRNKIQAQHQKIAAQNDRLLQESLQALSDLEKKTDTQLLNDETLEKKLSKLLRLSDKYEEQIGTSDFQGFLIFMRERPKIEDLMVLPEATVPQPPTFIPGKIDKENLAKQFGDLQLKEERSDMQKRISKKNILSEPYLLDTIETDVHESLYGLRCTERNRAWIRGSNSVVQMIDKTGKVWDKIDTMDGENEPNDLAISKKGDVVITNWIDNRIQRVASENTPIEMMNTEDWIPRGICFGNDGTFYVTLQRGWEAKVQWNKGLGEAEEDFQYDENGRQYFRLPWQITVNKINGDVCVSDTGRNMVIVLEKTGKLRFFYDGPFTDFHPRDLCTDELGHILVADIDNNSVHIIDETGQFLANLNTRADNLVLPFTLSIDSENNLWIGERDTKKIKVVKYRT
ncbi:hypothetical protein FSP39_020271 [Pinctada imbricata]|uniref:Uncharacterized protein n=1 Tax=Pinctada imbricata TaxID=66713 RepID=A0AA88XN60_PINIB|nr:hypothetical protein FSP39_020271 [Pinctada imbricata]